MVGAYVHHGHVGREKGWADWKSFEGGPHTSFTGRVYMRKREEVKTTPEVSGWGHGAMLSAETGN